MIKSFKNNIFKIDNLDLLISIFILISACFLYVLTPLKNSRIYSPIIIILIVIPIIYMIIRPKLELLNLDLTDIILGSKNLYIINILFVNLFTMSIIFLYFSFYERSFLYFLIITSLVALIILEIITTPPKKKLINLLLLKIILIGLNLRLGIQFIFPDSYIWYDPWYHQEIVNLIINTGFIPNNIAYSSIPGMHIFMTIEAILTNLSSIVPNYINITLKTALTSILIYLICSKIVKNDKLGLMSALIYVILDRTIIYDVSFTPTTFTTILALFIIYIVFKQDIKLKTSNTIIILILITTMVVSHTLTPTMVLLVLLVLLLSSFMFEKIYKENKLAIMGIVLILGIFMLSYWMYVTGYFFDQLLNIFKWSFNVEKISPYMSFQTTSNFLSKIPLMEHFLSYIGLYLIAFFSTLGFLYSIFKKDKYILLLSLVGISTLFMSFIGIVFKVYTIPDRWWYYSFHLIPIITSIGILVLIKSISKFKFFPKGKKIPLILITGVFIFITFFSITDPISNLDSPILSPNLTVRHMNLNSEIVASDTLERIHNQRNVLTDIQFATTYYPGKSTKLNVFTESTFTNKTYTEFKGLIIIRKYILDGNTFDARGIYQLNKNEITEFQQNSYNKIYDSNSVLGYLS